MMGSPRSHLHGILRNQAHDASLGPLTRYGIGSPIVHHE